MSNNSEKIRAANDGTAIGVGLALGAGLGAVFDNIVLGVSLGLMAGVVIETITRAARRDDGGRPLGPK